MSQLLVEPEVKQQLKLSQILIEPDIEQQVKQQLKPSQILRQTTMTQHFGNYGDGNKVCALGAIGRYLGWDGTLINLSGIGDLLDTVLPEKVRFDIVDLNDNFHKDFLEIADWLESKGY